MSSSRLWDLVPVVTRQEDLEAGGTLQALLDILSDDVDAEERSLWDLFDQLFIETCDAWAVPYVGELVANDLLYDASRNDDARTATELFTDLAPHDLRAPIAARARADVARTIYYRRRKGTPAMLEELARNVTGWPMHLVECFELLDWPQALIHLRSPAALLDVRSPERCERVSGPFSDAVRTVDVRLPRLGATSGAVVGAGVAGVANVGDDPVLIDAVPADPIEPPYHPRTAAFFGWRLQASPLVWLDPRPSATCMFGWTVSPLGNLAPLFSRWEREGDEFGLATEPQVPQPIRRSLFSRDLDTYRASAPGRPPYTRLYGEFADPAGTALELAPAASLAIFRNGVFLPPTADATQPPASFQPQIVCMRLDPWPAAQPAGAILGVDVVAGRFVLGTGFTTAADPTTSLAVAYHPGQAAGFGGGGYDRAAWLIPFGATIGTGSAPIQRLTVGARPRPAGTPPPTHATVSAAVAAWVAGGKLPTVITIQDSSTYDLLDVMLEDDSWLVIEAANNERPHLRANAGGWQVGVNVPVGARDRRAVLTLSGLLIEGWIELVGEVSRLRLWHTTVVPGRSLAEDGSPGTRLPSIVAPAAAGHLQLRIELAFSIVGPIWAPAGEERTWVLDSVIDGLDTLADGTSAPFAGPAVAGPSGVLTDVGPALHIERSTILGAVNARELMASESILTGRVQVQRTQEGCVRFSFVPDGSVTPRRYRTQPEATANAASAARVRDALAANPALTPAQQAAIAAAAHAAVVTALLPAFTARWYGEPAYAQLRRSTPAEITRGADDGSEMGALCHLKQSSREDNLRLRLAEYLPFGLDPALVYVT